MTRLLVIALAVTLILAGCTPEPRSHAPTYELVRGLLDHEDLKTTVGYIGSMEEPEDRHSAALQAALGF